MGVPPNGKTNGLELGVPIFLETCILAVFGLALSFLHALSKPDAE